MRTASEWQGGLLSKALYPAQVAGLAAVYVLAAKLSLLMAIFAPVLVFALNRQWVFR